MDLMHCGLLLLLLFCSACSYQFRRGYGPLVRDPDREWDRVKKLISEEMAENFAHETKYLKSATSGYSGPAAKRVPEYLVVTSAKDQKKAFKPEKGSRPLPAGITETLLQTAAPKTAKAAPKASPPRPQLIEMLCHVDRIYLRVRREIFKTTEAYKSLKLGNCPVNQGTKVHYYFLYLNTDCQFKAENNVDYRQIVNSLQYKPAGPVIREMPFDIPVKCIYPRFFHSFQVGFYPKLQGGTVYKALQPQTGFKLTPQDGSGNEITGSKTYTLGQPMYFEAKRSDTSTAAADQRIYINKCYMTATQDPNSSTKHVVIDNRGCMVDSKVTSQSKYIAGTSKLALKFSVGSMIFQGSSSSTSQQLYMHCDISLGSSTATESAKACHYDSTAKMWKELYGNDAVCSCCDSTCASAKSKASKMTSSHSLHVDLSHKAEPQKKSFEMFSWEDPDSAEHLDFLKYWDPEE
ncbi:zona pellucida sperm-binding protein 3 [Centropristis striata]|uniref:zona pellucida sperm-binding protein 3 n=1 Tax=Centropristis striata TaxID=184440 RepID=UPI0027DF1522|nr:zona pellucida sperm-binding protein 3 [Centropristis striata]